MHRKFHFRGQPRRWYLQPLILGIALILLTLLFWMFPRLLLFILLFPLFTIGVALTLYGLDLWRGVPDWRERITRVRSNYWPGEDD